MWRPREPWSWWGALAALMIAIVQLSTINSAAEDIWPSRPNDCPAGPAPALAQLRHRAAPHACRGDGRAIQRLPVVVPPRRVLPLRQGSCAFGDA